MGSTRRRPGARQTGEPSYRRAPSIVSFWKAGRLRFSNYSTGSVVEADPVIAELLDYCGRWRTADAIVRKAGRFDRMTTEALIRRLVRLSLLQRSDRPPDASELAMADWASWNPAAGFFHSATRNVRYPEAPADAEWRLRRKARTHPPPVPTKRYGSAVRVALPPARTEGELPGVLLERRTSRAFARAPVKLADIATLLGLTWGVQRRGIVRGQGPVVFKTSPSGGARHPIEAYLLARRVRDLDQGLYHYDALDHRLERLGPGMTPARLETLLGNQPWFRSAAAVVFMTAVFAREQWRYSSPRAYRVVHLDAGHLCQTFCLVATWLGLAPFSTMALADSEIERLLGIDGISESVMYAAGVGVPDRPSRPTRRSVRSR